MLAPFAIEDGEQDLPLEFTHHWCGQLLFPLAVGAFDVIEEGADHEVTIETTTTADLFDHLLLGDGDRVERLECGPESVKIPILRETL